MKPTTANNLGISQLRYSSAHSDKHPKRHPTSTTVFSNTRKAPKAGRSDVRQSLKGSRRRQK
jgi:hypothetical protein